MAIYALIGGKVNRENQRNQIEARLIKMTNKIEPSILFVPFAVKDEESSVIKFKKMMNNLPCKINIMYKKDISLFEDYLKNTDILYIGGGVSDDLIDIFLKNHLDDILRKYESGNIIYAGSSAGAMLYAKVSMGDKYMYQDNFHTYNYKMVYGLGLLNISICPHYQREDLIIYNDEIKEYGLDSFGIEEDTCLIIDGSSFFVLKDDLSNSVYYFDSNENYLMSSLYEGEIYENKNFRPKRDIF